jgi:hypothetical protein
MNAVLLLCDTHIRVTERERELLVCDGSIGIIYLGFLNNSPPKDLTLQNSIHFCTFRTYVEMLEYICWSPTQNN